MFLTSRCVSCDTYCISVLRTLIFPSVVDAEVGFVRYVLHFLGTVDGMARGSGDMVFLFVGEKYDTYATFGAAVGRPAYS